MNSYTQLRQPIAQILAFFSFLIIVMGYTGVYYSDSLENVTSSLKITTGIELSVYFITILGLFVKPHYSNKVMWTSYFIMTVVVSYLFLYSIFNMYFWLAVYSHINLSFYWNLGISVMTVSFLFDTIANIILINVKTFKHHMIGFIFRLLAGSVYIIYIILYFIVPNEIYNRDTFIVLIFITISIQVAIVYMYFMYGDYTYSLEKGEVPE